MVNLPCFTIFYNKEQPWFFRTHRCCYRTEQVLCGEVFRIGLISGHANAADRLYDEQKATNAWINMFVRDTVVDMDAI